MRVSDTTIAELMQSWRKSMIIEILHKKDTFQQFILRNGKDIP